MTTNPSPVECVLDPNAQFIHTITMHNTMTPLQAKIMLNNSPLSVSEKQLVFENYMHQLDALKYQCHFHTRNAFENKASKILQDTQGFSLKGGQHTNHMQKIMHLYDTQNILNHAKYVQLAGGKSPGASGAKGGKSPGASGAKGGNGSGAKGSKSPGGTHAHTPSKIKTPSKPKSKKKKKRTTNEDFIIADVTAKTIQERIKEESLMTKLRQFLINGVTKYIKDVFDTRIQIEETTKSEKTDTQCDDNEHAATQSTGWFSKLKQWGGVIVNNPVVNNPVVQTVIKTSMRTSLWMFSFMLQNPAQAAFFLLFVKMFIKQWCRHAMIKIGRTRMMAKLAFDPENIVGNIGDISSITATHVLDNWMQNGGYDGLFTTTAGATVKIIKVGLSDIPIIGGMLSAITEILSDMTKEAIRTTIEFNLYKTQLNQNWKQLMDIFELLLGGCFRRADIQDPMFLSPKPGSPRYTRQGIREFRDLKSMSSTAFAKKYGGKQKIDGQQEYYLRGN